MIGWERAGRVRRLRAGPRPGPAADRGPRLRRRRRRRDHDQGLGEPGELAVVSPHGRRRPVSRGSPRKAGHYESFYIKACRPGGGQGIWIRHTVHKRPGAEPNASIWFVLFDRDADGPRATKVTVPGGRALGAGRLLDPGRRRRDRAGPGRPGTVATDALERQLGADLRRRRRALQVPAGRLALRGAAAEDQVRRALSRRPLRAARSTSTATTIELAGWPGMIGHNWGSEHAERWVWLEGTGFAGRARHLLRRRRRADQARPLDDPLDPLRDARARRRAPTGSAASARSAPRRIEESPDRLRLRPPRQGRRRPRPRLAPRRRTSSAGSTPTRRAPSTTRSTARSPTSS